MYQRKRRSGSTFRGPPMKRQNVGRGRRSGGLVPTYRGFTPRAFSRGEWKYLDQAISNEVNTTATFTLLDALAPGSSASQRIGQKIAIRSLQVTLRFNATVVTAVEQQARWFLVFDRQANGANPTGITDILLAGNVTAPRALTNRKRFKIVADKLFTIGATAVASGNPQSRVFKKYIKFRRPVIVDYNAGVAGTIADIVTNSLFFVTLGTEANGATDSNVIGNIRMRYTDQ